jgi:acetoin utilization protein AcuB
MKAMPLIQKFMTAMPHTVGHDIPLKKAKAMMKDYQIRHLPVLDGGKLVGMLTERDMNLASSFQGSAELTAENVMMPMTYVVRPDSPLNEVAMEMSEKKYGSAVVQQENGKVVGIFTAVDALRVLADLLHENYKGV